MDEMMKIVVPTWSGNHALERFLVGDDDCDYEILKKSLLNFDFRNGHNKGDNKTLDRK
jgi:hypothetical protein